MSSLPRCRKRRPWCLWVTVVRADFRRRLGGLSSPRSSEGRSSNLQPILTLKCALTRGNIDVERREKLIVGVVAGVTGFIVLCSTTPRDGQQDSPQKAWHTTAQIEKVGRNDSCLCRLRQEITSAAVGNQPLNEWRKQSDEFITMEAAPSYNGQLLQIGVFFARSLRPRARSSKLRVRLLFTTK
jgi:hypothetical protein